MNRIVILLLVVASVIFLDWYAYQTIKVAVQNWTGVGRLVVQRGYWVLSALLIVFLALITLTRVGVLGQASEITRNIVATAFFGILLTKIFLVLFSAISDVWRVTQYAFEMVQGWISTPTKAATDVAEATPAATDNTITRSEFLAKTGAVVSAMPLVTMGYGILSGAHDYRVHRQKIYLPNLPKEFHGLRVGQLSDIHSGSFFNKTAVKGGVEMLLNEKPDVIFFTGDLVNNYAKEVEDYIRIFDKVKAPLGVYSVLGNHDYSDYVAWDSAEAKRRNLQDLMHAHKLMGWHLLNDEHIFLEQNKEKLAVIGIQNWGAKGNFPKYGNLHKAHAGTEEAPVKLLLSHDPSHWDAQVRKEFKDIDLMMAGHTHGMQFGIETEFFKWSPVQYMYKQWAGLYTEGNQHLYVNRGFGYLGFPGRIGILPEITVFELCKA
ncbi:hypothetical protein SAMN05421780_103214 [Flexibacter flexilis DSM 6793]|uniref:Calcineurin-like phosphoesterase domain-containing protein n=1 Tax=Flexibacter flexilis DSM 6793 TaxID=927664 RepID=A0A1I1H4F6_9BACT|nr:metallophosphoesterase [Flexibacter flexilis]SFC19049.1 hypothetical protein SAMN05421780_103214 [Flexibacter flexilis DSM 6793]